MATRAASGICPVEVGGDGAVRHGRRMTTYAEFRIRIERGTSRRTYRVEASGLGGEDEGRFRLPFTETELENFVLKIGRTRRGVRRIDSPEMELARAFGGQLFSAVMDGKIGELYRATFVEARQARPSTSCSTVPSSVRLSPRRTARSARRSRSVRRHPARLPPRVSPPVARPLQNSSCGPFRDRRARSPPGREARVVAGGSARPDTRCAQDPLADRRPRARTLERPAASRDRSEGASRVVPSRDVPGLFRRLELGAPAAGADERPRRCALDVDDERLEVGLHAAVGSNAVHPRRLRVEAAHRYLAADRAGAGHAWSSGGSRWRSPCPEGPERSGRIAHGLPTPMSGLPDPVTPGGRRPRAHPKPIRPIVRHSPGCRRSGADGDARVVRRDRLRRTAARTPPRAGSVSPSRGSRSTSATRSISISTSPSPTACRSRRSPARSTRPSATRCDTRWAATSGG